MQIVFEVGIILLQTKIHRRRRRRREEEKKEFSPKILI